LIVHFDWFCSLDKTNHCKGARIYKGSNSNSICFKYDEKVFKVGPKPYFMSYPILNFHLKTGSNGSNVTLKWYPSEYLYREKPDEYCLAAEKYSRHEILIGGTMMRQHNFIFDIEANQVGIARAKCNEDYNQVLDEKEMINSGQRYGLDPSHSESLT
jgi:hypothetical protein